MNAISIKSHSIMAMNVVVSEDNTPTARVYFQDKGSELEQHDFPLLNAFDIHACNEFLRSLKLNLDIQFQNYSQYAQLVRQCVDQLFLGGMANA